MVGKRRLRLKGLAKPSQPLWTKNVAKNFLRTQLAPPPSYRESWAPRPPSYRAPSVRASVPTPAPEPEAPKTTIWKRMATILLDVLILSVVLAILAGMLVRHIKKGDENVEKIVTVVRGIVFLVMFGLLMIFSMSDKSVSTLKGGVQGVGGALEQVGKNPLIGWARRNY